MCPNSSGWCKGRSGEKRKEALDISAVEETNETKMTEARKFLPANVKREEIDQHGQKSLSKDEGEGGVDAYCRPAWQKLKISI